ncbi:hypothetical protein [Microbulbifer variabilis]|uniref:hypothetical protein n=1 Tax=Microbulbifer variabilis TaxID=266805 RepID=UPI001CFE8DCB|nr:hypothetical protein [Microbulbifer variabilis]
MKGLLLVFAILIGLVGCGNFNSFIADKKKNIEYYRIFDIKTDVDRYTIAKSASDGLGRNVGSIHENQPIPESAELPEVPGRFKIVNPLQGSALSALAESGGHAGYKIATCDGASWIAGATRVVKGQSELKLTACLFPYSEGYHLDLYANFSKQEGGLMEISRKAASAMVGTPEQWTEKTFVDIVRKIHADTGAEISFLEGYPRQEGTPWLDSLDKIN